MMEIRLQKIWKRKYEVRKLIFNFNTFLEWLNWGHVMCYNAFPMKRWKGFSLKDINVRIYLIRWVTWSILKTKSPNMLWAIDPVSIIYRASLCIIQMSTDVCVIHAVDKEVLLCRHRVITHINFKICTKHVVMKQYERNKSRLKQAETFIMNKHFCVTDKLKHYETVLTKKFTSETS